MRVLLTLNIDNFQFSIGTAMREPCSRMSEIDFYSFSRPLTQEDWRLGKQFWSLPNIHKISIPKALGMRFDVVHQGLPTWRSRAAARWARARAAGDCIHVFTVQVEPYRADPAFREWERGIESADIVVAVSGAVAGSVKSIFGRTVDFVIPNGVDLEFFDRAKARPVDFDKLGIAPPFVMFVGHLEARKRPDIFFDLANFYPEVSFIMLGGYVTKQERDSYLAQAQQHPNVRVLGLQPRELVRDLYARAAALIFPSEIEGMPLSVLEAQAMGVPVLAQPKSSLPEVVQEGVTGWLMPGELRQPWAARLRDVLGWDETRRHAYASQARAVTRSRFSWDVIAPMYREIYMRAAGSNR